MKRTALILFAAALLIHGVSLPFMNIPYDEAAYAWTAQNLARDGGWFDLYGKSDLFFFPPLFNYIAALFIKLGLDRLYAVRLVTTLFSSAIPPLLYLLAVRSGLTVRAGLIAAALWFILPWGWHLSVVGMVETPWLCCLLTAVYFLQNAVEKASRRDALLSALAFAAGLWIKETPLGALPLFLFALRKERALLAIWGAVFAVLSLPLLAQTLLPHTYDLFFEVTTPLLWWQGFEIDPLLRNWGLLHGASSFPLPGWSETFTLFTLAVTALCVIAVPRDQWRDRFILRFAAGFLLIYLPFFMFFPKKFPYYLLPVCLFLLFFTARRLAQIPRFAILYGLILLLFAVPSLRQFGDRSDEGSFLEAFALVEPGARVAMTLPRKAEYVAEKGGLRPLIVPAEWVDCVGRADECIFGNDYLMTDPMFLMMLYCRRWPMGPESCDLPALTAAKERLTPLLKRPGFTLYRVEKTSAAAQ